ncbi:CsaB protein [Planococcus halocryophilus Or1]|uniref:Polysaccharide pyruvyl transferase CsaB n=1 Tax=Planococcus halocryophilus TaxID=1215089 RepID=A0A1C7DR83_9BACL|nr:polysaccharide pyruvyl transferase CsaB [Planococcus halocryophilus]ANU13985.1 polysaccharide pyruvyl transferase CsaB [Planococcus halocryophilus]EMF47416.1 CsaB protein [Planococcus halocryophilus Or1]
MRVVLSGYYGFDNVGDEAILYAIIHSLKEYDPNIEIMVLSNKPEKTAETYRVQAVNRWSLREVRAAIKSSDGLISGGGSLLQDKTGRKSIPYYAGVMKIAQQLKKPVFVYAQGMGPIDSKINQMIVKHVLNSVELLTVRDQQSKQLLEKVGVTSPIELVPDPVMGIDTSSFQSSWLSQQDFQGKVITVSVRDWENDDFAFQEIARGLDQLATKGREIVFVPMHGKHDFKTSRKVAELMKNSAHIAPHDSTIQEKMAIIKESDVLFGMRLHALIFAAVGYTPFVALSYDPKIDSFANIVGQPVLGHVESKDWNATGLVEAVEHILSNYPDELEKITGVVMPLQKSANETAHAVIDSIKAPSASKAPLAYKKVENR